MMDIRCGDRKWARKGWELQKEYVSVVFSQSFPVFGLELVLWRHKQQMWKGRQKLDKLLLLLFLQGQLHKVKQR